MKLIILLSGLIAVQAGVIKDECDGFNIDGVFYERETLATNLDRPFFLDSDRNSDNLYFGYTAPGTVSVPAKINLKTKELSHILGIKDGFAHAINHENKEIFVGGADGIYKYDLRKNKTTFYGAGDKDIWKMYYRDVLYFTSYPDEKLYVFNNGLYRLFEDLKDTKALNFIIDADNIMYFNNNTGFYRQKEGTNDAELIKRCDLFTVRALATDPKERLYVCLKNGVYLLNKDTLYLQELFPINDAFGLTFDRHGNFIYADATSIYRLEPNEYKKC